MTETVDILIEKATLLTMDQQRRILTDGAIAIRGDRIVAARNPQIPEEFDADGAHSADLSTWSVPSGLFDAIDNNNLCRTLDGFQFQAR